MNLSAQIAKLIRAVYFGGNWCDVNLKDTLKDVSWQQAASKVYSCNTIAVLVYHMNYYVNAVTKVLEGTTLDAHDKYSFDCPAVQSQDEWENLLDKFWIDAEKYACLVEQLPDSKLLETFTDEKYGNYYRNIQGVNEHLHYHLGQIVFLKKILLQTYQN
jgi:hypothetical protein